MTRLFYNEITDSVITFNDVKKLYDESVKARFTQDSFPVWFENVQSYNNGVLTEVYKFSMTVWLEDYERYEDIVAIGSNAKNACIKYGIDHNMFNYPVCISSRKIN